MPTFTHSLLQSFITHLSTPNQKEKQIRILIAQKKLEKSRKADRLTLQHNLYLTLTGKTTDSLVFVNACQHSDRIIKFIGYTGALHIEDKDVLLLMVNSLKNDLDRKEILAVRYMANAYGVPVNEIRDDIEFECNKEMLILFYKLYRMDKEEKIFLKMNKKVHGIEKCVKKHSKINCVDYFNNINNYNCVINYDNMNIINLSINKRNNNVDNKNIKFNDIIHGNKIFNYTINNKKSFY